MRRITSRQQHAAVWSAQGTGGESPIESHSFLPDSIDVRGGNDGSPIDAAYVGSVLIGDDDHYVGFRAGSWFVVRTCTDRERCRASAHIAQESSPVHVGSRVGGGIGSRPFWDSLHRFETYSFSSRISIWLTTGLTVASCSATILRISSMTSGCCSAILNRSEGSCSRW